MLGEKPGANVDQSMVGSLGPLELRRLVNDDDRNAGFRRASQLLREGEPTGFSETLITAMQWAGRAAADQRQEEAFLLYVIALESLILGPKKNPKDVGHRLRLRIAHLLGETDEQRQEIITIVSDLYGLRSDIVHIGAIEVTDGDVGLARAITYRCIGSLLLNDPFSRMVAYKELDDWFGERLRGAMGDRPTACDATSDE